MSTALRPTSAMRPQDRRALIIGAIVVATAVTYARVVRPAIAALRADREMVTQQRALLTRERALLAAAPLLPRMRADVVQTLAQGRARLFAGDSVAATAALTSYMSDVALATGVRLSTIDGRPPATRRGVTQLQAELRGEGTWREILAFIRTLESAGRLVDVMNVRIERGPRGGPLGGDLVTISATVAGYGSATLESGLP